MSVSKSSSIQQYKGGIDEYQELKKDLAKNRITPNSKIVNMFVSPINVFVKD